MRLGCMNNKGKLTWVTTATIYSRSYNLIQELLSLSTLTEQTECVHHNSNVHELLLTSLTTGTDDEPF